MNNGTDVVAVKIGEVEVEVNGYVLAHAALGLRELILRSNAEMKQLLALASAMEHESLRIWCGDPKEAEMERQMEELRRENARWDEADRREQQLIDRWRQQRGFRPDRSVPDLDTLRRMWERGNSLWTDQELAIVNEHAHEWARYR